MFALIALLLALPFVSPTKTIDTVIFLVHVALYLILFIGIFSLIIFFELRKPKNIEREKPKEKPKEKKQRKWAFPKDAPKTEDKTEEEVWESPRYIQDFQRLVKIREDVLKSFGWRKVKKEKK